ncbi:MAG: hypothetical protein FJZ01_13705 [Candidatus Sericytochromatia bacterium]|nr:hypothetical protein [Candidatus Tanganyikabacteria bacterium]
MPTTLDQIIAIFKQILADKMRRLPCSSHPNTRDRITRSRLKDLPTHTKYVVQALGRDNAHDVLATELVEDTARAVETYLAAAGKGEDVIRNTMSSIRLLRDLAIELGEPIPVHVHPALARPGRNRLTEVIDGKRTKIAKSELGSYSPYGLHYRDWPDSLKAEFEGIKSFMMDPLRPKRRRKAVRAKYMVTWLNRAERAFGYLVGQGVPKEELSFKRLIETDFIEKYREFLFERRGHKDTYTTYDDLFIWQNLAANFYLKKSKANAIADFLKGVFPVRVKDKSGLLYRVPVEQVYDLARKLIAEAEIYEANVRRKHGRKSAMAVVAFHWHRAAAYCFLVATWLREKNIVQATILNLFKRDGVWRYRYGAVDMKGDRDKGDPVMDLWERDEFDALLFRALDKAVQLRPHLVDLYLASNPDAQPPLEFFLNRKGKGYTEAAFRNFIDSVSRAYLGHDRRFSPHDIRTIIPSAIIEKFDDAELTTIQHQLHHSHFSTTEQFYAWCRTALNVPMARERMERREKQDKAADIVHRLHDEIVASVIGLLDERETGHQIDDSAVERIAEAVKTKILKEQLS